jgi:arabinofuranan 3-O-arabinosyltransferase
MSDATERLRTMPVSDPQSPHILPIFVRWRLNAYGYTLGAFYAVFFLYLYWLGLWLLNKSGIPVYHDFTNIFVAGWQALHGEAASVYDSVEHLKAQDALVGTGHTLFSDWAYPPTHFLILAPLALLPYVAAFLIFEFLTLLGCMAILYLIVRRASAIALLVASPFTAWNFLIGQNGFLTASLLGGSLVFLERRPVLAGLFAGCLTYKPQFGILLPIAFVAAGEWRAIASATVTAVMLAGVSLAVFGGGIWGEFAGGLGAFSTGLFSVGPDAYWGVLQTVYGFIRWSGGGSGLAWLGQAVTTCSVAAIVWLVWRSRARYALKAATLAAAALCATPKVLAYDLAAVAIPIAFLAQDQLRRGLLRGEQTIALVSFAASLSVIPTVGRAPVGAAILLTLLCLILRRAHLYGKVAVAFA